MLQVHPVPLDLLPFPLCERGVPADDLRLRALPELFAAAAPPCASVPVEEPDFTKRLPGVVPGPVCPLRFVLGFRDLGGVHSFPYGSFQARDPPLKLRHLCIVLALPGGQERLPKPDMLAVLLHARPGLVRLAVIAHELAQVPARLGTWIAHSPGPATAATRVVQAGAL
jgi:hypothetical protein